MTELKINFAGADVYDVEPQQLPNLYHGAPVRLYGRYRTAAPGAATARVNLAANISGAPVQQSAEVQLPKRDDRNPEIERMWASHRVERLMAEARATGSPGSTRGEIVRLCEGYSIASEYASFIVLENDAEYARWKIDRRSASRLRRDQRSQDLVRQQLDVLRRQTEARLGPAPAETPLAARAADPLPVGGSSNPAVNFDSAAGSPEIPAPAFDSPVRPSRDVSSGGGGGGGGGAIDPLTALAGAALVGAALGLGAAAASSRTRRHSATLEQRWQFRPAGRTDLIRDRRALRCPQAAHVGAARQSSWRKESFDEKTADRQDVVDLARRNAGAADVDARGLGARLGRGARRGPALAISSRGDFDRPMVAAVHRPLDALERRSCGLGSGDVCRPGHGLRAAFAPPPDRTAGRLAAGDFAGPGLVCARADRVSRAERDRLGIVRATGRHAARSAWQARDRVLQAFSLVLVGLLAGKIGLEMAWGRTPFVDSTAAGFIPLPLVHAVGAAVGTLVGLLPDEALGADLFCGRARCAQLGWVRRK